MLILITFFLGFCGTWFIAAENGLLLLTELGLLYDSNIVYILQYISEYLNSKSSNLIFIFSNSSSKIITLFSSFLFCYCSVFILYSVITFAPKIFSEISF